MGRVRLGRPDSWRASRLGAKGSDVEHTWAMPALRMSSGSMTAFKPNMPAGSVMSASMNCIICATCTSGQRRNWGEDCHLRGMAFEVCLARLLIQETDGQVLE